MFLLRMSWREDISAVYEMESETCDTQAGHPEAGIRS